MMIEVKDSPQLRELTTLRLGGPAVALVSVGSGHDIDSLVPVLEKLGGRPVVLGRGSNILADDGELPLTLVKPAFQTGPVVLGTRDAFNGGQEVLVHVGAGMSLPKLLAWASGNSLAGLEGLVGIPGSVGGSIAMNAGSYGCEIGSRLVELSVFSPACGLVSLKTGEFSATYREMNIPLTGDAWWMACDAVFALTPTPRERIAARMAEFLALKKSTQPVSAHSAGCVFRNPENTSAGLLLDKAGFRGKRLGGMGFSAMHANFLVNESGGTSAQALELLAMAREKVRDMFGVELQSEVKLWPSS